MEERVITREVKISSMDEEWENVRSYSVSLNNYRKNDEERRVFIAVDGVDDESNGCIGIPLKEVNLLMQALKEFC